jgi:hypothetical protein
MSADDSPWIITTQPQQWDPEKAKRIFEAAKAERRRKHLERLAERKRDREAAKRKARGLSEDPTDYPWLKPDWVDPPVLPLRLRNRR